MDKFSIIKVSSAALAADHKFIHDGLMVSREADPMVGVNGIVDAQYSGRHLWCQIKVGSQTIPAGAVSDAVARFRRDRPDTAALLSDKEIQNECKFTLQRNTPYRITYHDVFVLYSSNTVSYIVVRNGSKVITNWILSCLDFGRDVVFDETNHPAKRVQDYLTNGPHDTKALLGMNDSGNPTGPFILCSPARWTSKAYNISLIQDSSPYISRGEWGDRLGISELVCTKVSLQDARDDMIFTLYSNNTVSVSDWGEQDVPPFFFGSDDREANLFFWTTKLSTLADKLFTLIDCTIDR